MVAISEKEFQNKVVALAIMYGWRVTHFRASQVGGKWMTAIQGHSGFPDLVLAHENKGLVFAELKTDKGRLDPAQITWLTNTRRSWSRGLLLATIRYAIHYTTDY
jgi:hypothetical protein